MLASVLLEQNWPISREQEVAAMPVNRYEVEFFGGPLDGVIQSITVPAEQLNALATYPINRNLFRLLNRRPSGKPHPVTSVAAYQLQRVGAKHCYFFLGAEAPVMSGSLNDRS
jgi:hypothetical protein